MAKLTEGKGRDCPIFSCVLGLGLLFFYVLIYMPRRRLPCEKRVKKKKKKEARGRHGLMMMPLV